MAYLCLSPCDTIGPFGYSYMIVGRLQQPCNFSLNICQAISSMIRVPGFRGSRPRTSQYKVENRDVRVKPPGEERVDHSRSRVFKGILQSSSSCRRTLWTNDLMVVQNSDVLRRTACIRVRDGCFDWRGILCVSPHYRLWRNNIFVAVADCISQSMPRKACTSNIEVSTIKVLIRFEIRALMWPRRSTRDTTTRTFSEQR